MITLICELDRELHGEPSALYCGVADKDFDHFLGSSIQSSSLIYTDFCSMDGYLIDDTVMEKFLRLCVGDDSTSPGDAISALADAAEGLFFARLANETMSLGLTWIKYDRLLSSSQRYVDLDFFTFCTRLLNSNACMEREDEFLEEVTRNRIAKPADHRDWINGHDFINLLYWVNRRSFSTARDLERAIRGCLEVVHLSQFSLFQEIERRCA